MRTANSAGLLNSSARKTVQWIVFSGSSARKTVQWTVFSENGSARPLSNGSARPLSNGSARPLSNGSADPGGQSRIINAEMKVKTP